VRREVLKTMNDLREKFKASGIGTDPLTNSAADAYANYLLTEPENQEALE
jgi:predicted flavoprotein YhiN